MDFVNRVRHTLRLEAAFVRKYRYDAVIDSGILRKAILSSICLSDLTCLIRQGGILG